MNQCSNPFNSSNNLLFSYSQQHISTLSNYIYELYHQQGVTLKGITTHKDSNQKLQAEVDEDKYEASVEIHLANNIWYFYFTQRGKNGKMNAQSNKKYLYEQGQFNSFIFALIHLKNYLCAQPFEMPIELFDLLKIQKKLGQYYLQALKNHHKFTIWEEQSYEKKRECLTIFGPHTREQFLSMSNFPKSSLDYEVNQLFRQAINQGDSEMVRLLLQSGFRLKFLRSLGGEHLDVYALIKKIKQENPKKEVEYIKIEKNLRFYGVQTSSEVQHKAFLLKKSQTDATLNNVAERLKKPKQIFQSFFLFLQKAILGTLNTLQIIASGRFSVYEDNSTKSIVDSIISAIFQKVPVIGSQLADKYGGFRNEQRVEFGKRIVRKLPIDSKQIVADFSIRVVETFSEKIVDAEEMSLIAELKEYFRKKVSKILKYNEKQFIFDGQNFTISWMILSSQFVGRFIDFLSSQEANQYPSTLGIRAAYQSFGYHKVDLQQFSKLKLSTTYDLQNALILCKLTSYITDISKYPTSLDSFGAVYWSDTKLQPQKIRVKAQSAIIITDSFALFLFNSSSKVNLEKKKTKKCSKISISQDLCDQFQQFLDLASFNESKGAKSWSIIKLLDGLSKKKGFKFILVGYKFGAVIASLLHCILAEDYQCSVDSIISYNFQIPLWCHKSSLSQAYDKLKYFYSNFVFTNEKDKSRQKSDYGEIGKRFYLKLEQNSQKNLLQQFIILLDNQQVNKDKSKLSSQKQTQKIQQNFDIDDFNEAIFPDSNEYDEDKITLAIQNLNFSLFKYLINLYKVKSKQKLNKFLSLAIQMYPHNFSKDQIYFNFKREQTFKFIKYLIEHKNCDPNELDFSSRNFLQSNLTHLQYALHWGFLQLARYFIQKGGDINKTFRKGLNNYNSLSLAIQSSCVQLVRYLVEEKKVRMDNLWLEGRMGPIGKQMIFILVRNGADPNTLTKVLGQTLFTFLGIAIGQGDIKLMRYLLEKGADPNIIVNFGTVGSIGSGTQAAARHASNLRALKLQLEYGGNIDLLFAPIIKQQNQSFYNKTALDYLKDMVKYGETKHDQFYQAYNYLKILKMQGYIKNQFLSQLEYKEAIEFLLKQGLSYHTISTYYVSEFLYTEGLFNRKTATKNQNKYRKHFDVIRKFMFEGNSKIQRYNSAIKILYSFHNPKRHDQIFKICNQNTQDEDFIFLKIITYLQLWSPSSDSSKNEYLLQNIQVLLDSIQRPQFRLFIFGEVYYLRGLIAQSIQYYKQSISYNAHFRHPQLKLLKIEAEQKQNLDLDLDWKLYKNCNRILPIQLASIMEDIQDIFITDQFLKSSKKVNLEEGINKRQSALQRSLKVIFSVNPIIIRDRLTYLIPQKVHKMSLTAFRNIKGKETIFTAKGLIKAIDYAYFLLKQHKPNALVRALSKKQELPSSKQSTFFQGITSFIQKLVVLRQTIQSKCSQNRDFENPKDYEYCLGNISDLIEYYESYVSRVINNYNKDHDGNYQKFFYEKMGRELDIKKDVIIYSQRNFLQGKSLSSSQPYSIMRQEAERLTASSPESDQMYGTHTVILLPANSPNQIYFKHKPYAPGIQYAVSALYKLILPNTTPETTLIKVVNGNQESIFLASAAVTGRNFAQCINQTQYIDSIDIKNFSSLFFCSFLVCTGDSKPDNFVLHFNYDSNELISTELVSIDNDIAFYRRGLQVNQSSRKIYSDMLNVLYLLPQMAMPVSPYIKEFLSQKENQPEVIVAKWLGCLHEKNQIYQNMKGFTAEDLKDLKLPIKLPRGAAAKVYSILKKIRSLISHEGVTHAQIFEHLSPSLAYFYNKYRDNSSAVNSLKNLYVAAGADPSIVNSLYSFDKNINSKAWNTLSSAKRKEEGSFNSLFNSTTREQAEIFIEAIDFSVVDDTVLQVICKQLPFMENLSLNNATQVQACKMVDSSTNGIKNLRMNQLIPTDINIHQNHPQPTAMHEILPIDTIFDIFTLPKIPNRQSILRTLLSKKLSINYRNNSGQTILFETVSLICSSKISLNEGEKLLNALLDCGANPNFANNNNLKLIELEVVQRKCPQVIIIILEHQPTFFKRLLRQGRVEQAQMIAESSSTHLFLSTIQENGGSIDESSALRQVFKNRKYRQLASIIISRLQQSSNSYEQDLIYIFVQNYSDEDAGLLESFIKRKGEAASVLLNFTSYFGYCPADIAYNESKFMLLTVILNSGGGMGPWHLLNIQLSLKAVQYKIKLDINDVMHKYHYKKVNKKGLTVFELMALHKDPSIITYLNLAQQYREQLKKIALNNHFFELIQALLTQQELQGQSESGHPLANSQQTKELSKLLAKHGFSTTLREALTRIDLQSKFDSDGNTVLLSIGLKYHEATSQISRKELLQQIKLLFSKFGERLLQVTMREDGNTLLHLAAQWGDHRLAGLIINTAKKSCERLLLNAQLLSPDELAQDQQLAAMIRIQKKSKADALKMKLSEFNFRVKNKCISVMAK